MHIHIRIFTHATKHTLYTIIYTVVHINIIYYNTHTARIYGACWHTHNQTHMHTHTCSAKSYHTQMIQSCVFFRIISFSITKCTIYYVQTCVSILTCMPFHSHVLQHIYLEWCMIVICGYCLPLTLAMLAYKPWL